MQLLVVGGGAGGATAAFEARKFDPEADITIISGDKYTHYSPCGLPFAIAGKVPKVTDLIVYPPSLYRISDINLYLETVVERIYPEEQKVEANKKEFFYDKLIIATGSLPIIPSIPGTDKEGVFTIKGLDDGKMILDYLSKTREVAVIGSGLLGLEMATAFLERGLKVKVVEREENILPNLLDFDMADRVKEDLESKGIEFYLSNLVKEILGKEKVEGININGKEISADLILLATGVRPNIYLAKEAGVEIGEYGGIRINKKMETSLPNIYAAGDCVESIHGLTLSPISSMSMLGSTAVREGKVAGINAVGGNLSLSPVLNTTISDLTSIKVGVVGVNTSIALECGFEVVSVIFEGPSLDPFFPGGSNIIIKLLGDKKTGKIIGAQILGKERIWGRILAISFAMQKGMTIEELACAETAYVPSISPTFDPITLTAEMLLRRMK